jgi:cytosine/adenosine deaminase-related metal-dependent hydrolase
VSGPAAVAALAGRRPDAADTREERFPLRNAGAVRARIAEVLRERGVGTLVCSAACGADLLALDAAAELGLRRVVVLPFEAERFRESSVVDRPGDWGDAYDAVVADVRARGDLVVLSPDGGDSHGAYQAATATILARAMELAGGDPSRVVALLVWEGGSRGAGDHTAAFRDTARAQGMAVQEIRTNA